MAHIREIGVECYHVGCRKEAVVEVLNRVNASHGRFCRQHGTRLLRQLQVAEAQDKRD